MFRSAERIFRSAEHIFSSGEHIFRSAEYKLNSACSNIITGYYANIYTTFLYIYNYQSDGVSLTNLASFIYNYSKHNVECLKHKYKDMVKLRGIGLTNRFQKQNWLFFCG